jgi:CBS domain containing-hemolysin-like protein
VKEITSPQEKISFINEGDTIQHVLNQLTTNKTNSAIVVDSNNRPVGIFDVESLFGYCNDKITQHKIPFEALLEKLEEIKLELSVAKLNEIFQYSYQSKQQWQIRSIPASRSIMHLLHIMSANPGLRKVPVLDEKGNVEGIVELSNALRFILENDEEFSDLTKRPVSDLPFTRKSLPAMKASREQLMASEFTLMWQKHVDGHLGCCNRSSSLDLFFNYVHYILLDSRHLPGRTSRLDR